MKRYLNSFVSVTIIIVLFIFGMGIFSYGQNTNINNISRVPVNNDGVEKIYNGQHILDVDIYGSTTAILLDGDDVPSNGGEEIWVWGENGEGKFGNGTTSVEESGIPVQTDVTEIISKPYHHIIDVELGGTFIGVLVDTNNSPEDGEEIWTWGNNTMGQLGNGSTMNSTVPIMVNTTASSDPMLSDPKDGIIQISLGDNHIGALVDTDDNVMNGGEEIWAWGSNTMGQLGVGNASTIPHKLPLKVDTSAIPFEESEEHYNSIDFNYDSSGLLLELDDNIYDGGEPTGPWWSGKNEFYLWGDSPDSKLGNGYEEYSPFLLPTGAHLSGDFHYETCDLSKDSELEDQFHFSSLSIGLYNTTVTLTGPTNDHSIGNIVEISGVVTSSGQKGFLTPEHWYTWAYQPVYGQLTTSEIGENDYDANDLTMWGYDEIVKAQSPGNYTIVLLSEDGIKDNGGEYFVTLGTDDQGQQGNGDEQKENWEPSYINWNWFETEKHVLDFSASPTSVIALVDTDNNVGNGGEEIWTWGSNDHGELGQGNIGGISSSPEEVYWPDFYVYDSSFTIIKNEPDELVFSIEVIANNFSPELVELKSGDETFDTTFIQQISGDDGHGIYSYSSTGFEAGKEYTDLSIKYSYSEPMSIKGSFVVPIGSLSTFSIESEAKKSFIFNITLQSQLENLGDYLDPNTDIELYSEGHKLDISLEEQNITNLDDNNLYEYKFKAYNLKSNTKYGGFSVRVTYHYEGNDIVSNYIIPNASSTTATTLVNSSSIALWIIFSLMVLITILILIILFL